MSERTALYRLFGTTGDLLYIGISKAFGARWTQHAEAKPWWPEVSRQTVEWFDTRNEAEIAEKSAIKAECPKFNIAHTPRQFRGTRTGSSGKHLFGAAEIGEMLDVSRQRVQQLINRADFPAPFDELKMGKVWWRKDVVAWATARGRSLVTSDDEA